MIKYIAGTATALVAIVAFSAPVFAGKYTSTNQAGKHSPTSQTGKFAPVNKLGIEWR